MTRIKAIEPEEATGQARELFDSLNEKYGMVPNLARALANSPAALRGYLALGEALDGGALPASLREQIALTVSQANGCGYCVAVHCAIGSSVGLSDEELADARQSTSTDSRIEAALQFTKRLVENRGWVTDEELEQVRRAGYDDGDIAEIVAIVAWKTFANYFNHVAETDIDFPAVPELSSA